METLLRAMSEHGRSGEGGRQRADVPKNRKPPLADSLIVCTALCALLLLSFFLSVPPLPPVSLPGLA